MPDAASSGLLSGVVSEWNSDEGWGVLASPDLEGPVWAHFSSIDAEGFRELSVGDPVVFSVEEEEQDGYRWRAVHVRAGGGIPGRESQDDDGPGYSSGLDITFD
ncbi:cold shock domain-containing protein [Streptomyces spectabilis]|uniref:cold-shock protein n=1 Tax=Streptomyces spectabilis TaxID=68270 RepID=UPI0033FED6C6